MLDNQKELFVVVDNNDTIIEYRSRYDCHHDKTLIHRVVGVIISNAKNQILLQKRSMIKDMYPGYYTIAATGHVTKGQSYQEAALREMEEEIGVVAELTFLSKFICVMEKETEMVSIFTAKHNGPFTIAKDEVDEVAFFDRDTIAHMKNKLTPLAIMSLEKAGVL